MKLHTKVIVAVGLMVLYTVGQAWLHYNAEDIVTDVAHAQRHSIMVEAELEVERAITHMCVDHVLWLDYELTLVQARPGCAPKLEE